MAYASKEGRARVNSRSPQAAGQCDRCGFLYSFSHLRWQMDYSGAGIYNKRILVCEKCYDTPQQQLKVIVIPPDPLPVLNARPPDYINSETNYRYTSGQNTIDPITGIPIINGDVRQTNMVNPPIGYYGNILLEDNSGALVQESNGGYILIEGSEANESEFEYLRVTQQTGEPPYGLNQLPGTEWNLPYVKSGLAVPPDNEFIPYTGQLPPVKNYICIWNNTVLWKLNWSNTNNETVNWSTTVL